MKRINFKELLWFMVFLGFTLYLYYLISTGKIVSYIAPRMINYIRVSLILFLLMTIQQFSRIFTVINKKNIDKGCILMIITLIIGMASLNMEMDTSVADKKGVTLSESSVSENSSSEDKNSMSKKELDFDTGGIIKFEEHNYLKKLDKIWGNVEGYKDREITIDGFVYRDERVKEDEFIVGRMLMSCCAADSQIVGFMVKWPEANTLNKDEWVNVYGTIDSIATKDAEGNETILPIIKVKKVRKISKPNNVYIYPSW